MTTWWEMARMRKLQALPDFLRLWAKLAIQPLGTLAISFRRPQRDFSMFESDGPERLRTSLRLPVPFLCGRLNWELAGTRVYYQLRIPRSHCPFSTHSAELSCLVLPYDKPGLLSEIDDRLNRGNHVSCQNS